MKLDKLTAEQNALLPVVRDEWVAHGLSTVAADRKAAESALRSAYASASLPAPNIHVRLGSPMTGAIGAVFLVQLLKALGANKKVRSQVLDQVWDQVRDQVLDQVWVRDQVGDQVWDQVWDQVRDQVGGQVWGQVGGQVGDQVRDQVWDQVGGQVGDQVRGQLNTVFAGQHEATWASFYDYFRRAAPSVNGPERLAGLMALAQNAGWTWLYRGAVLYTERPTELHRDAQGRLHNDHGMAIRYPDGWGFWSVHGVPVPQEIVEHPETLTPPSIMAISNTEVRRVAIERFGWDRFIPAAGLALLDEQPDPANAPYTLALYEAPERLLGFAARVLLCTNASPERSGERRRFGLTVPVDCANALAAASWTFGVSADEYRELERAS